MCGVAIFKCNLKLQFELYIWSGLTTVNISVSSSSDELETELNVVGLAVTSFD